MLNNDEIELLNKVYSKYFIQNGNVFKQISQYTISFNLLNRNKSRF